MSDDDYRALVGVVDGETYHLLEVTRANIGEGVFLPEGAFYIIIATNPTEERSFFEALAWQQRP